MIHPCLLCFHFFGHADIAFARNLKLEMYLDIFKLITEKLHENSLLILFDFHLFHFDQIYTLFLTLLPDPLILPYLQMYVLFKN